MHHECCGPDSRLLELVFRMTFVKLGTKDEWAGASSEKITGWRKSNSGRSTLGPNRREHVHSATHSSTTMFSIHIHIFNVLISYSGTYLVISSVKGRTDKKPHLHRDIRSFRAFQGSFIHSGFRV